jgi:hypothetical protein
VFVPDDPSQPSLMFASRAAACVPPQSLHANIIKVKRLVRDNYYSLFSHSVNIEEKGLLSLTAIVKVIRLFSLSLTTRDKIS